MNMRRFHIIIQNQVKKFLYDKNNEISYHSDVLWVHSPVSSINGKNYKPKLYDVL